MHRFFFVGNLCREHVCVSGIGAWGMCRSLGWNTWTKPLLNPTRQGDVFAEQAISVCWGLDLELEDVAG